MGTTLADLANLVQAKLVGDGTIEITGAAPLGNAGATDIAFLDDPKKASKLADSAAAAWVVPADIASPDGRPVLQAENAFAAFQQIYLHFHPQRTRARRGVSTQAWIADSAVLGEDVEIAAGVTVEEDVEIGGGCTIHAGVCIMAGCRIGPRTVIYPNAVLYPDTIVGSDCILHAGVVLGATGFGYRHVNGRHELIPQLGWVELGDHVELGANTTVDRATFGPTVIGSGTKVDDQVMIAHNCQIGQHNLLCSQVGIAGSVTTGDYVVMAGQVGVRDHVHIGTGATLGAMAGVINNIPAGSRYVGIPATPERDQMILQGTLGKLPEMRRQLKALEKAVSRLASQVSEDTGQDAEAA